MGTNRTRINSIEILGEVRYNCEDNEFLDSDRKYVTMLFEKEVIVIKDLLNKGYEIDELQIEDQDEDKAYFRAVLVR